MTGPQLTGKVWRSALLSAAGGAAAFIYQWAVLQQMDWAPAVAAAASFVANLTRLLVRK